VRTGKGEKEREKRREGGSRNGCAQHTHKNKAFVRSTVTNDMCMISMYHAHISNDLQQHILEHFRQPNSMIRLLICTIAFGMGVEIGDVKRVIHWGKVQSLLVFWQ